MAGRYILCGLRGWTWLVVCLASIMTTSRPVLADGLPAQAAPASAEDLAEATAALTQYIYTRQCEVRLYPEPGQPVILPFHYPSRPTLTVNLCGDTMDLLFDTGAFSCLLQPGEDEALPSRIRFSPVPWEIAPLEAKQAFSADGVPVLQYALVPVLSCNAQLYLRDVPIRVYPASANNARDYAGAFAAILLADYIVVVDNTREQIELHERQAWQPPMGCVMLPLVLLPRGFFTPAWIEGEQYWFHFDTGFSGELGLSSELLAKLAPSLAEVGTSETFSGWHAEHEFASYELSAPVELRPYPAAPWDTAAPLQLTGLTVLDYSQSYNELQDEGYRIGGIMGSGLWQRYNYALDLRQQRLYIMVPME